MDSFESIVKTIFENKGYWVKTSFKVNLTKEEKRKIGRPSSPRWEIDIIAYKGSRNEVLVIECKSYLDNPGVKADSLKNGKYKERYKLFNEKVLQSVVFSRLITQLTETGLCQNDPSIKLCLAVGNVASDKDRQQITEYFDTQDWGFYSDKWIKKELIKLSESGYENDIATVVTKILTR